MKTASCFLGNWEKNPKNKPKTQETTASFFLTCHKRIDFHEQNFMDYALESQPIWTVSTSFQKHSLLIASRDNILVSFSEKFAGLFWRKQPEWLAVKRWFWFLYFKHTFKKTMKMPKQ